MDSRDQQALRDILAMIDRSLGFPIKDFETLESTDYLQDALLRCLEVIGEATKRLSSSCRDDYPEVPWRGMAGLRDVLIHAYDQVDLQEVWQAYCQLPSLQQAIVKILNQPDPS